MSDSVRSGFFSLLCFMGIAASGFDLSHVNIAYQYDIDFKLSFRHRVIEDSEDNVRILYELPVDSLELWSFNILGQSAYNSNSHDTLSLDRLDTLIRNSDRGIYSYTIDDSRHPLILFAFHNLSLGIVRVFDVRIFTPGGFPRFYPVNENSLPVFRNYVTSSSLRFRGATDQLHAYRYQERFGPADPPMGEMTALAPTLEIDSSIFFTDELKGLSDYHFYLFQSDTLADNGMTLLKCPSYFPELKTFGELIMPMRYITTTTENRALLQSTDPRQAFEQFWLDTYGTKFRAKGAIRFFFQRVEEANVLFTDYKQGWKTDRGILYIIYGLPDVVVRTDRTEIWKYDSGEEFEFFRLPSLFATSLYSLKRDMNYEKSWYLQVGEIRKGP